MYSFNYELEQEGAQLHIETHTVESNIPWSTFLSPTMFHSKTCQD